MKGLLPALLFSAAAVAQQSGIEGLAIHSVTRQPLAGVHIRLLFIDPNQREGPTGVYGSMSDREGRFSIDSMPAGSYLMLCERAGFVQVSTPERAVERAALSLKAGERISGYRIEMAPVAIISGRALDEYGDPVPNISISATPVSSRQMQRVTLRSPYVTTDDRGEYRIGVAPGKYYIQAQPRNFSPGGPAEIRTDGTSDATYGPTYFPDTPVKDRAAAVEAEAGSELSGVDIRLVRQRILSVSGTVSGMTEGAAARVMLESADQGLIRSMAGVQNGHFTLPRVEPGRYRIYARGSGPAGELGSQIETITVESGEVSNLELRLIPPEDLAGTFEIAGSPPDPTRKWVVRLSSATPIDGHAYTGETDRNGAFRIAGLIPGSYRVAVDGLPEDGYIASVHLDGVDVPNRVLDLGRGAKGARVRVVVNRNGGRITGRVLDAKGQPLENAMAFVILSNDAEALLKEGPPRAAADGTFTLKAIRPGKYRLFAVNIMDLSSSPQEAIKLLFERAPELEVHEGDRITRDVRVAGGEAANGK